MAPYHITHAPYAGSRLKLVLAFDVGTTFSGVSYSILNPGEPPEIKGVTKFPAHEQISGASKIPTIIYYDKAGNVCAVGAEALAEGIFETAEQEGWIKAEWFKMHIRPKNEASSHITARIPALPPNKTVAQVLADFLVYLYKCARNYIQETHANGKDLWASVEKDIDFVISHPNGWEGYQQTQIREAVITAGFVPDTREGHARVSLVTEGEACLHFSIRNGLPTGAVEKGDGVVIVDAGKGTIDISTYSRQVQPGYIQKDNVFEEIAAPQCHFYGSVFVSIHARLALQELLKESEYLDDLDHIIRCFDHTTKIRFSDDSQVQYIKFGSTRDNDANCGIRFGQLKLAGEQVASFFEPSIKCIVDAIKDQIKTAHKRISHVVLVGGFASSDWLFTQVQSRLSGDGLNIIRPEICGHKAVSDGAISFYLDHLVKTRVSKMAYGTFRHIEYDASDAEHRARLASTQIVPSGRKVVPGSFAVILPRNMQVQEEKEFQKKFWKEGASKEKLNLDKVTSEVWAYTGNSANPKWKNVDEDCYKRLCTIEMDLSHLPLRPSDKVEGTGGFFYLEYGYILQFSAVELKAQVSWVENGTEKRSPAKIIYDPDD